MLIVIKQKSDPNRLIKFLKFAKKVEILINISVNNMLIQKKQVDFISWPK